MEDLDTDDCCEADETLDPKELHEMRLPKPTPLRSSPTSSSFSLLRRSLRSLWKEGEGRAQQVSHSLCLTHG